jgi:hypothetical protein
MDAGTLQVQAPSGLAPLLADMFGVEIGGALVGPRLPAREDIPDDWRRAPCQKDLRVRPVQDVCFLASHRLA